MMVVWLLICSQIRRQYAYLGLCYSSHCSDGWSEQSQYACPDVLHSVYPYPFFSLDSQLPLWQACFELAYTASSSTISFLFLYLVVPFLWLLTCEGVRIQLLQKSSINIITILLLLCLCYGTSLVYACKQTFSHKLSPFLFGTCWNRRNRPI